MFILLWTGNLNSNQMMNSSNGLYWDADTGFWVAWVIYTGGGARKWVCTVMLIRWKFELGRNFLSYCCFFCLSCFFGLICFLLFFAFLALLAFLSASYLLFGFFLPPCAILALADSVQSPIVSFTQYCLLASSTTIYWKKRET